MTRAEIEITRPRRTPEGKRGEGDKVLYKQTLRENSSGEGRKPGASYRRFEDAATDDPQIRKDIIVKHGQNKDAPIEVTELTRRKNSNMHERRPIAQVPPGHSVEITLPRGRKLHIKHQGDDHDKR